MRSAFEVQLSAFWDGLSAISAASFAGVVLVALAELLGCYLFLDERLLAALPDTILKSNPRDDRARLTSDACRLFASPSRDLNVLYAGASTAHLALLDTDHPAPIEQELSETVGEPVHFWNLTADGQSVEEYVVVGEHVPNRFRGVFVASFSDWRKDHVVPDLSGMRDHELLALDVTRLGPLAYRLGEVSTHMTGNLFFDHLDFFAARREILLRNDLGPPRDRPLSHRRARGDRWEEMGRHIDSDRRERGLVDKHFKELAVLQKHLSQRGVALVVLEATESPAFAAGKPNLKAYYLDKMAEFEKRFGVTYWNLNDEAELKMRDFWDPVHIGSDVARARYEHVLVNHLGSYLKTYREQEANRPPTG